MTGTAPNLSVLLPTYNRAKLVGKAIASVLAQTYGDFELLVLDDGSEDDTDHVVNGFADPRLRYLRLVHRGAAAAENVGLSRARGRFVAFLDDDDEWLPEKLQVQVAAFADQPASTGVVYTARWLLRHGRVAYGPSPDILRKGGWIHSEIVARRTFVPLVCAMVRRECFDVVGGFDEDLPTSNDYDLWIRMSRLYRFEHIPRALVRVHATPGSLSTTPARIVEARRKLLAKHATVFDAVGGGIVSRLEWQTGSLLLLEGRHGEGRHWWRAPRAGVPGICSMPLPSCSRGAAREPT